MLVESVSSLLPCRPPTDASAPSALSSSPHSAPPSSTSTELAGPISKCLTPSHQPKKSKTVQNGAQDDVIQNVNVQRDTTADSVASAVMPPVIVGEGSQSGTSPTDVQSTCPGSPGHVCSAVSVISAPLQALSTGFGLTQLDSPNGAPQPCLIIPAAASSDSPNYTPPPILDHSQHHCDNSSEEMRQSKTPALQVPFDTHSSASWCTPLEASGATADGSPGSVSSHSRPSASPLGSAAVCAGRSQCATPEASPVLGAPTLNSNQQQSCGSALHSHNTSQSADTPFSAMSQLKCRQSCHLQQPKKGTTNISTVASSVLFGWHICLCIHFQVFHAY